MAQGQGTPESRAGIGQEILELEREAFENEIQKLIDAEDFEGARALGGAGFHPQS